MRSILDMFEVLSSVNKVKMMPCIFLYPPSPALRLQWIFCFFLLIMPWRSDGAVYAFGSSMNTTEIDLRAPVSRILVTKYFPTVFVGGTNFVAQLSSQLHLLYRFAIGPVEDPEYCWPDPAPCDNTVRLLKVDYNRNLLLVCGSAYQGTCTLHPTNLASEHSCLLGKSTNRSSSSATLQQPSPGVVVAMGEGDAPVFSQRLNDSTDLQEEEEHFVPGTTAHFLPIKRKTNRGIFPTGPYENCRSPFFGQVEFYDEETPLNQGARKTRQVGLPGSLPPFDFVSRLVVAGLVDLRGKRDRGGESISNKKAPLPLSVREIRPFGPGYTISYALGVDGYTPSGFQLADSLQNSSATSFFQDYKLSFSYGNYSYFVFLQRSICASGQMCITTRVSRVCHENPRLTPYVEIPISCRHGGKEYPLLTSAVLGFSDIQLNLSTERTPVLFAAFGAARKSSSRRADARLGGAVCVFTIHTLNKELNFNVQLCNHANNLAQPASWIKGAKDKCVFSSKSGQRQCSSDPDNPYVQGVSGNSIKALVGFHKTAVCTLWTYTPRLFSASSSLSYQKISLFLLTLDGIISKIILSMTKKRDDITIKEGNAGISEYHKLNVDLLTINGTWNGQPLPVGATDGSSAFMYVSNGHKVFSLSLDYCRQFQTCEMCVASGPCLWCPAERSCLGEESTGTQCRRTESNTCPPRLDSFQPTSVPTDGGSVLTLYGNQLGTITDEYSKVVVSICDQPCDNVKAKGTNVTCTVRKKCSLCQDSCRVNVSVEIRSLPSKYNLTGGSRLTYVNPEVSEFFPEYGPVSGRTQVSLTGQHLDSGSDTTVKIAEADCEIVSRHKSVILCNVVGSKQSKPGCGSVDLTIDNFHTNVSQVNYCLRPDPIIQSIAPLRSTESGGIIITIKGSHLDSATSFSLELHTPLDGQDDDEILLLKHESNCTLPNGRGELMICPSPPIPRFETLIKKTLSGPIAENGKHLSMDLHLVLDSRNVLQDDSDLPHKFVVYGDPTLFGFTPGTEDAFVDVRNPVLNIRGENFPTWIPYSNIKVTIANWTCQITSVTQKLVKCDGKKAAEFVLKEMGKLEPTQIVTTEVTTVSNSTNSYLENFTVSDGQTGQTEMETTSTVLTTVTKNSNSTNGFMSTAKTSERGRERNSNKGQSGLTKKNGFAMKSAKPEGSDVNLPQPPIMSLLDNDHEPVEITEKPMQRFSKEFTVKIEIGYLTRGLGKIQIGYDPERPPPTNAPIPNDSTNSGLWKVAVPAAAATLVLLLVAALVLCCQLIKTRRRARRMQKMAPYYMGSMSGSAPPGSAPGSKESAHPTLKQILESIMEPNRNSELDNLIINLDRLTIGNSIGSGNFGCVYEGSLRSHDGNTTQKVAIKTLQDSSSQNLDLQSFVQEAVIMKDFCHPHVLGLVGLAERAGPEGGAPYVILPYMENGDLLTYVRDPAAELSLHDVIKFGADIASGMAYLSSLKLVHRDLAARNCMLDNHQRAKVADFGLCRDIYEKGYYSSDNRKKLPIRWMAVESIEQGAYSTKSDVWSFGVVLWEMSCRGVTPYPGVDGWDVINYLRRRRLAPPFFCPDELYNIMMQCWNKDPTSRPEFNTLNGSLLSLIGQSPSKAVPIPLKRGASHGDTLKASSSSEHKYVKLPEVAGPIGKRAMARQNRKSDTEEDLKQDKSIKVDLEADGQNPVTVVVTEPSKYVIKDVQITIPACFGHRDLTQSAVLEYKNLVDNYEPAPRFTNSIKLKVGRSKKKRRESSKSGEKVDMRSSKPPIMPRSSKTKLDVSDHSGHSSLALDHSDGMPRSSGGSIRGMQSFDAREVGNYFQLEPKLRDSIASDSVGQRCSRSSSIKTGSVSSLLDSQSRRSSFEPGQASNASSQVSSPAVQRSLLTRQAGGSPRSSSSGRQLPYAGIPPSSVRPHVPVAMEQSFFVEDEVSSSLDTQL